MPTRVQERARNEPTTEADARRGAIAVAVPRGDVSIAESVVEKIAGNAALTVPGIYPAGDTKGIASALSRGTEGIRARVRRNREVSIEMRMAVDYGEHMPTRGEEVRTVVARTVRELTDLEAREIKVKITEVIFPEGPASEKE
jgi:uncharacterized alkaline shock family protein YloU